MRPKFITDAQDAWDGFLDTAGAEFYGSFSNATKVIEESAANVLVEIPLAPALTSEAADSLGAQSGPTTAVSMTTGGITINLLFDAAAMAAPASFRAGIQQAASLLTAAISDQITVNIRIDYSGIGGGAAAGPDNGLYVNYSTVRADLINNTRPAMRRSTLAERHGQRQDRHLPDLDLCARRQAFRGTSAAGRGLLLLA